MKINKLWIHQFITKSFINGIPIYFCLSIFGDYLFKSLGTDEGFFATFLGICVVWWALTGIYFFSSILISREIRENTFAWVFGFRERDEREELIVANSAKSSFVFMAGIVFIFFFVSTARIGYQPSSTGGYHGQFTLGHIKMSADPIEVYKELASNGDQVNYPIFGFPLSITGTLLLLLVIQFAAFKFFSRANRRI